MLCILSSFEVVGKDRKRNSTNVLLKTSNQLAYSTQFKRKKYKKPKTHQYGTKIIAAAQPCSWSEKIVTAFMTQKCIF